MRLTVKSGSLTLAVDDQTGQWLSLSGGQSGRSWLSPVTGDRPGLPFLSVGPVSPGVLVPVPGETTSTGAFAGRSARGGCGARIESDGDGLTASYEFPTRRGPRAGIHLPLDHLDREFSRRTTTDRSEQLMPVIAETAPDLQWSFLAWHRSQSELLVTAVEGQHAGWRIIYSYPGHRMVGFRVFAQADDVIVAGAAGGRLPSTTSLRIRIALAESRTHALELGSRLAGASEPATAIFTMPDWREFASRFVGFHPDRYQLPCGAMARAVGGDTERPDRRTTSGRHFGSVAEAGSCMTGEFGGFGMWAALLHPEMNTDQTRVHAVDRYFDWLLNRDAGTDASTIFPGTIWPAGINPPASVEIVTGPKGREHTCGGSTPAAYHLWGVPNYAQFESWAVAQLADAVRLGKDDLREPLAGVLSHFIRDHIGADGAVYNQRHADDPQDYCSVDAPLVHIIRAAQVLEPSHRELSERALTAARRIADFILTRGLDFPTEGEQCTEDGSISCAAWGLAFATNELPDPNAAWLPFARTLLEFHRKFEMSGRYVRTEGSTIRFWETMYESDDWGPSINAGHAWTLWTAFAEWEMHRATGEYSWLRSAWTRTLCVASKARSDGGFPVCFTPDPIPQIPHADVSRADDPGGPLGTSGYRREGEMTTVMAGNRYTSTLSVSSMFPFVFAASSWYHTSGVDPATGQEREFHIPRRSSGPSLTARMHPHCPSVGANRSDRGSSSRLGSIHCYYMRSCERTGIGYRCAGRCCQSGRVDAQGGAGRRQHRYLGDRPRVREHEGVAQMVERLPIVRDPKPVHEPEARLAEYPERPSRSSWQAALESGLSVAVRLGSVCARNPRR